MLSITKPTAEKLRTWSGPMKSEPFNYPGVGSTLAIDASAENFTFVGPRGFTFDHRRTRLGDGDDVFDAAADAVMRGQMFPDGWFVSALPLRPLAVGDVMTIAARCGGLWWANAARIVYLVDEHDERGRRRGFAYGTLRTHVERGEERFMVEQLPDGSVWYDLAAYSRPRHLLIWATYPLARFMQEKFRRHSAAAMKRVVAEAATSTADKWL